MTVSADWYQIDWDDWRVAHPSMTFHDQQEFYSRVLDLYPRQQSFNPKICHEAFDYIAGEDLAVLELGGWDGGLASQMLHRSDVARWTNIDLIEVPQVCRSERYEFQVLTDYLWNLPQVEADVFVACHTIEHLSTAELAELVGWLRSPFVYLDAPLKMYPLDWTGFPGSHILDIGWEGVNELLEASGYESVFAGLWAR